jgi:ElaB/YqjD/DUF883 family membrane-anchored ribosome-binding protein
MSTTAKSFENGARNSESTVVELNRIVSQAEELLKTLGEEGGAAAEAVRQRVNRTMNQAKVRIADASQRARGAAVDAAHATDRFVHDNPWRMFGSVIVLALLAAEPAGQTTMPRRADAPKEHAPSQRAGLPADPLFDKPLTATDDAAFVRAAVESGRQGVMDARAAESGLTTPELRAAAAKIGRQHERTLDRLEALAREKGWDLPQTNPVRAGTVPVSSPVRTSADFIIHEIARHQATLEKFRVQARGQGDRELRGLLRESVPGYEQNLEMLLGLKL